MAEPILQMNLEESICVIMKCNTVLPGKTIRCITVYLLVYLNKTDKTCLENANLLWKYASAKNVLEIRKNNSNHSQAVWEAKPRPLNNNLRVGNSRLKSQIPNDWIIKNAA